MTDPDTNYATNAQIQALVYKGQTCPGDNTISADELLEVKNTIDGIINTPNNWTSNYSGASTYPFFKNLFIRLFKAWLDDEPTELTEQEEYILINRFGTPAIVCSSPEEDWDEPSGV